MKIFLSAAWECPPHHHHRHEGHVCPRRCAASLAAIVPQRRPLTSVTNLLTFRFLQRDGGQRRRYTCRRRPGGRTQTHAASVSHKGDSVMSGWRMKTPTNKGWQEAVDGINVIEKLKLNTTSSSTEGAVLDWDWTAAAPTPTPALTGYTGRKTASRLVHHGSDGIRLIQQKNLEFSICCRENMSNWFLFDCWLIPVEQLTQTSLTKNCKLYKI